jgi:regulator of replication initiation timing
MGDYYCHGINITQMSNRNADLAKANIELLEENAKLRSENVELKKQMESWKSMHRDKWNQWASQR